MPGYELVGKEEKSSIDNIFSESNGVLFGHGFNALRNNIFRVREFEKEFSSELNVKYSQAVTSGTVAQLVAMKALGIKEGDEVITQSFTFVATVEAILALGAKPVIVDIDDSFNIDPKEIVKVITPKTKLIVPVHMLGNPCDMDAIIQIGKKYNIPILEDACEGLGGSYKGKMLGTITEIGVFSLDFAKTITTGEGGMICTNNFELFKYCKEYQDHGHESNPNFPRGKDSRKIFGMNYRMNEVQGAVGLAQVKKLQTIVNTNRRNKQILKNYIQDLEHINFRRINDKEGDLCDTLIFYFNKKQQTDAFLKRYLQAGYHTKNLPDAIDWHFSGTWNHMFENTQYENNWETKWRHSKNLLEKSIAIPIYIKQSEKEVHQHGKILREILNEIH